MMKFNTNTKFLRSLIFVLSAHIYILILMSVLRCIFYISNGEAISAISSADKYYYIIKAFAKGLRYDNIIVSYITILPLLVIPTLALFNIFNKKIVTVARVYYAVCIFVLLAISISNIPYYAYFKRHIDSSVLQWIGYSEQVYGMLSEEKSYILYFVIFILLFLVCLFLLSKLSKHVLSKVKNNHFSKKYYLLSIVTLFISYFLSIVGVRGGLMHSVEPISALLFSSHPVVNAGIINPLFFTTKVPADIFANRVVEDIGDIEFVNKELGVDIRDKDYYINSTAAIHNDTLQNDPNIVIVFMESFASKYLEIKSEKGKTIAPYIDQLKDKSYYFTQLYVQGTHTNQAIIATMYGIPSIFSKSMTIKKPIQLGIDMFQDKHYENMRKDTPLLHGFPNDLKNRGYYTQFFVPHTKTFDNLDFFSQANGFDQIYGLEDYPNANSVNIWGVSDEDLLNSALQKIDSLATEDTPIFTTILTVSNHPPYVYRDEFSHVSSKNDENALAYMDNCIRNFMEEAEKRTWYDNTIFIFLGDHGYSFADTEDEYNYPLTLSHVPLIIYSPLFDDMPKRFTSLMGQIDIYPVVMSLLDKEPMYNTFGTNVLLKERKYIYFSSDDKLGYLDDEYFYNYDFSYGSEFLYRLKDNTKENIIESNKAMADSMKFRAASMLKGAKYIIKYY